MLRKARDLAPRSQRHSSPHSRVTRPVHQFRTRISWLWNELSARMSRRDTYSGRRSKGSRYLWWKQWGAAK